jgi:large subunit ribosomal protein L37e
MTKGTHSMGKKQKALHIRCRRCGRNSYHRKHRYCAACGFGRTRKIRHYAWQNKKVTTGERLV